MKIVHIAPVFFEGWGYQENYISTIQADLGHDVIVITPAKSIAGYESEYTRSFRDYQYQGVRIIRLPLKWCIMRRFYWYSNLVKLLGLIKPDVIMIHGLAQLPVFDVKRYVLKNQECLLVGDFHADERISATNIISKIILHKILWRFVLYLSLKSVSKIYCTRPSVKEFTSRMYGLSSEKLYDLPIGSIAKDYSVDNRKDIRKSILSEYNISMDAFVVCTGGKIDSDKKLANLVKSLVLMNDDNVHLIIFGSPLPRYQSDYDSIVLTYRNIHLANWRTEEDIERIFVASDIAVFLGNHSVLWEKAICCALPTVFSYSHDRLYLNVGGNCVYVYGSDPLELKQLLEIIKKNPSYLSYMHQVAKDKGRIKFSYKNIVSDLTESWLKMHIK